MWDVNRSAAEASGEHLLFHAGALDAGGTGVLLPGTSGSGKSTLTAGLARAGLGYLTDELAALDLRSGQLLPYPKPITLKAGSFAVLPELDPDAGRSPGLGTGAGRWAGEEWQVAVGGDTGRRVGAGVRAASGRRAALRGRRADPPDPALQHRGFPLPRPPRGQPAAARRRRQRRAGPGGGADPPATP